MWVILQGEAFGRSILVEGGSLALPAKGQLAIRTLNRIKAIAISIDLILAQGLNMQ